MRTQICVELDPLSRVRSGDKATLWLDAERLHLFDPQSGDNLTRVTTERSREEHQSGGRSREEHEPESQGRHAASAG